MATTGSIIYRALQSPAPTPGTDPERRYIAGTPPMAGDNAATRTLSRIDAARGTQPPTTAPMVPATPRPVTPRNDTGRAAPRSAPGGTPSARLSGNAQPYWSGAQYTPLPSVLGVGDPAALMRSSGLDPSIGVPHALQLPDQNRGVLVYAGEDGKGRFASPDEAFFGPANSFSEDYWNAARGALSQSTQFGSRGAVNAEGLKFLERYRPGTPVPEAEARRIVDLIAGEHEGIAANIKKDLSRPNGGDFGLKPGYMLMGEGATGAQWKNLGLLDAAVSMGLITPEQMDAVTGGGDSGETDAVGNFMKELLESLSGDEARYTMGAASGMGGGGMDAATLAMLMNAMRPGGDSESSIPMSSPLNQQPTLQSIPFV